MALEADTTRSRAIWRGSHEERLSSGAGLLLAVAISVLLWAFLISVGAAFIRLSGLW
jgi:hypothetical protein